MKGAVAGARGLAGVVPEVVEAGRAVKQVMPMADDVTKLAYQLKNRLTQIPTANKLLKAAPTAEMVPRGGEAAYNAARAGMTKVPRPSAQDAVYSRMMGQAGAVDPRLVLGGGAALGGGLLAKKLYDAVSSIKSPTSTIQKANPFNRVSEILDEAGK
jgi:hypothetical protein